MNRLKFTAGLNLATALIQMTDDEHMKVEIVPNKTPAQVTGFTSAVQTFDRGQNATILESTTQSK